jgi:hypothetical protein
MGIDDFTGEESSTDNEAPIGVVVDVSVIVDTDDYTTALDVASQVADEIERQTGSRGVEVYADASADTFNPEE